MGLSVKLEAFEGPLDLLLHLLEKNKVSIYDIPIVEITNQYMEYIREMRRQDLNVMSEFLVMAATLLDIKSRWLLPKEETEEEEETDPRAELVEQLLQYKLYKYMSEELKDLQMDAGKQMYKEATIPEEVRAYVPPVDLEEMTRDYDLESLHKIFEDVIRRQKSKVDPIRSRFGQIQKEQISVDDKMVFLREFMSSHRTFSFRNLLEAQSGKVEIVVTFLVILELMKAGKIEVSQDENFGEIQITVTEIPEISDMSGDN